MATDRKKKFSESNIETEQQGLGKTQIKPYEPILSPKQPHILAQVYQLILRWGRECMSKAMPTTGAVNVGSAASVLAIAVEVEA